jgi:hypothetical protein
MGSIPKIMASCFGRAAEVRGAVLWFKSPSA